MSRSRRGLPDVSELSIAQLNELISVIEETITEKKQAARADTLNKLKSLAAADGFTVEELLGRGAGGRRQRSDKGVKLKAKYVGPNGETYTGRGPTPGWLKALEAKGHKRDKYLA